MSIDPNALAQHNGEFFGLETKPGQEKIQVLCVPWDVTTSYRAGTVKGPDAVLEASYQVDLFSPDVEEAWNLPMLRAKAKADWDKKSKKLRKISEEYLEFLEAGGDVAKSKKFRAVLAKINQATAELNDWVYAETKKILAQKKKVLLLGGDHAVPLGAIRAYAEAYPDLSILHFDAHADLRDAYEGFQDSHASIMFNALKRTPIKKIVQVGVRDCSSGEVALIRADKRMKTYFDWDLKEKKYAGEPWGKIADEIVSHLSPHVYISFDIDGLDPKLCPNTGTPVPGGLEFTEATAIIRAVLKAGKKVVGADLVEVAPAKDNEWDANVGARLLFQLACTLWKS